MTTIDAPRAKYRRSRATRSNFELYSWLFMRASGVLLIALVFGHLFVNLVTGEGVKQVDFAFIAGKWASPFWQVWDGLMLWLPLIHGGNGMRTITNHYVSSPTANRLLKGAILVAVALLILLGTLVITTFDPCPSNAAANTLPSFCAA